MTFSVVLCINYADTPRDAENHVYIYIHKCIHGDATRFSKSTRRSWNERYFEISILNFIIDKRKKINKVL